MVRPFGTWPGGSDAGAPRPAARVRVHRSRCNPAARRRVQHHGHRSSRGHQLLQGFPHDAAGGTHRAGLPGRGLPGPRRRRVAGQGGPTGGRRRRRGRRGLLSRQLRARPVGGRRRPAVRPCRRGRDRDHHRSGDPARPAGRVVHRPTATTAWSCTCPATPRPARSAPTRSRSRPRSPARRAGRAQRVARPAVARADDRGRHGAGSRRLRPGQLAPTCPA